jgi:tripartite-type tricarboxylate transporter receptor subunit TctC
MAMMNRRSMLALAGTALALPARAQASWPDRPVTLVAPFTPGGPVDALARLLAAGLQARSGVPAVVENRPGGGGSIGIASVARAAPDGTTLLVAAAGNLTINPSLIRNAPFNVERDLAPVAILASSPNVIAVGPSVPAATVAELLALAQRTPGGLSYGSPGAGSQQHLAGELIASRSGAALTHIPYRGSSHAATDLVSGQIHFVISNLLAVQPLIAAGRARAIAQLATARSAMLPDVPTLAEAGQAPLDVRSWFGVLVPRATPAPLVNAIHAACGAVARSEATQDAFRRQALEAMDESPDDFATRLREETSRWAEVIRTARIQLDN